MKKYLIPLFLFFNSCSDLSRSSRDCNKIKVKDEDFLEVRFSSLPLPVKDIILKLATVDKKMDTAFSMEKGISYSYGNPGSGKGYTEQVLKDKDMNFINGKCYEFILYAMPYIIYGNKIYSLEQPLGADCSNGKCQPDTTGINQISVYSLSLDKILK